MDGKGAGRISKFASLDRIDTIIACTYTLVCHIFFIPLHYDRPVALRARPTVIGPVVAAGTSHRARVPREPLREEIEPRDHRPGPPAGTTPFPPEIRNVL